MKLWVLIVLLAVLALVLVVGLTLGLTLNEKPERDASFLEWTRERDWGMEKRVRRSDLRASPNACLQNSALVLASGGRCRVDISSADDNVRALELELLTPGQVDFSLEHRDPSQGLNVETTLQRDDPLKVQIYERGATLILSGCSASSDQGCRIRIR